MTGMPVIQEDSAPGFLQAILRLSSAPRVRTGAVLLSFFAISLMFFNKVFTSDYGIHLAIGRYIVENFAIPTREFLIHPLLGQPMNYEEVGFQALLYLVYRAVGTDGVSVFVWMLATLAFGFLYLSMRSREVHPAAALITLLLFAMPFRLRLQPRPEIVSYLFCCYLLYACTLFYYRGNRRIIWSFPPLFFLWGNLHPSTLAGLAIVAAYGTQSLVMVIRGNRSRDALKQLLGIPLLVLLLSVIASFLNSHGVDSILTPVRLLANVSQRANISEMTPVTNSSFYPQYKLIVGITAAYGLAGLILLRGRVHDFILAGYGLRLPLQVARGMAFMSILCVPLVAQGFDGVIRRVAEHLEKRRKLATIPVAPSKDRNGKSRRKKGRKGSFRDQEAPVGGALETGQGAGKFRSTAALLLVWLIAAAPLAYGSYSLRISTVHTIENGIGLTEHKFSLKSAEFLRALPVRGNMFNFFDLGGFLDWQLYPGKLAFIDGRAANPQVFMDHQIITAAMGDVEGLFRKYGITYIVTKAVDSSGMVLSLVYYLGQSPAWELVFADGLTLVFVRNIPENREIIARYRLPKGLLTWQIMQESIHYTFLGINRASAYSTVANLYLKSGDRTNALRFFEMAEKETDDPALREFIRRLRADDGFSR